MIENLNMFRFAILLCAISVSVKTSTITIDQGTLNGTYLKARNGRIFNAFFGLPYAEPPVHNLRFKTTVEPKPWSGVWNASVVSNGCIQMDPNSNGTIGSEDCLYLNVYTPLNTQKGDNLSVIVYLYGGIFKQSCNIVDGPNYIMGRDVILVIPNYRQGVLGFLSTGDTVIPGNFGLKDQNMALRWVQKNIYHFGGDPNNVTLHGHSSGGVCVHWHTLSPTSKGLFQKVIIQSGTGLTGFTYFDNNVSRSIAEEFATKAGCPSTNTSQGIYDCLITMDPHIMPPIQEQMYIWDLDPDAAFRPTIEDKNVPDAFLTEIPSKIEYHSTDIPWIIGLTTGESAGHVARYLSNGGKLAAEIDQNFKLLFPLTLQYFWTTKPKHLNYISQIIRTHYFGNQSIGSETDHQMTSMYTEGTFGLSTIEAILQYPGPKYVYWYDYVSNYSSQNANGYYNKFLGVSHSDDIQLFYCRNVSSEFLNEQDVMFSDELIKRWVNFANTGNPNTPLEINKTIMGIWKPMSSKRIEYLFINLNGTMQTDLYKGTYQFWKSLPIGSKYYNDLLT